MQCRADKSQYGVAIQQAEAGLSLGRARARPRLGPESDELDMKSVKIVLKVLRSIWPCLFGGQTCRAIRQAS